MRLLLVLFLLSLCACAEFSFNQSSLSSPFSVTVLGITGGADVSLDTFLFDGSEATVHWADEPDETGYDVRIFEDDGITIRCSVSGLPADTISHTFAGCPLIEGQAYFAVVEKIAPVVATSVVEPTARSKALNKISSFFGGNENQAFAPYGFLYPATISVSDAVINETSGVGVVVASLSVPSEWPVTFTWSTSDNTAVSSGQFKDYDTVTSTTVTFLPGETVKNLQVPITDDPRDEFDQALNITLAGQTNVKLAPLNQTAQLAIIDDDPPPDLALTNATITEGQTTGALTLALSEISEKSITFDYATQDGTATSGDYAVINPTSTTFNPGDSSITFTIESLDDGDVCEFDENVGIAITSASNLGNPPSGSVQIIDNDLPRLIFSDAPPVAEGGDLVFTASLSDPCPTQTITFDWATVPITALNGLDFNSQSGSVIFLPNETTTSITVTTTEDTTREVDRKYVAIGARNKVNLEDSPSAAIGTIIDNEVGVATTKVVTPGHRSCALSSDGQIKCWGQNSYIGGSQSAHVGDEPNEMGDNLPAFDFGTWDDDNSVVTPEIPLTVMKAVSGDKTTVVLLSNERIKSFGTSIGDIYGDDVNELGNNLPYINLGTWDDDNNISTPEVEFLVKDIDSVRTESFCAHLINDRVKCWGKGLWGQLGNGSTASTQGSSQMGNALPFLDLGTWDHDSNPGTVNISHTVKQISDGCALLDNDRVKCWGRNSNGALGLGDTEDRGDEPNEMGDFLPYLDFGSGRTVRKISGFCAILDNFQLKCWGENDWGQLAQGDTNHRGDEPNEMGDFLPPIDLGTWDDDNNAVTPEIPLLAVEVFAAQERVCVILSNNGLKCFGLPFHNQLGNGSVQVGHTPATVGNAIPFVNLGTGRTALSVGFAFASTFVLRDDNTLVSFGLNTYGQLGYENQVDRTSLANMGNSLAPINLGTGLFASSISFTSASISRMCAVLNSGVLKCWGKDEMRGIMSESPARTKTGDDPSELGFNMPVISLPSGRTAQNLFKGTTTFVESVNQSLCAVLNGIDENEFTCWGTSDHLSNGFGRFLNHGDRPNSMGDNLRVYRLPNSKKILQILSRYRSSCALDEDLDLFCWGNARGGLTGNTTEIGYDPQNDSLQALVGTQRKVLSVSFSESHACAVLDNFTLKCWGDGGPWLGYGDSLSRGDSLATSGDNLAAVDLGTVSYPVQVSTGYRSTCALFANGQIKCWGQADGQGRGVLGYGDTNSRGGLPGQMGNNLPFLNLGTGQTAISVFHKNYYYDTVCAKRSDQSIVCWGDNRSGGHGNETAVTSVGGSPGQMGDALNPLIIDGIPQEINASSIHSCTVLDDNRVKCWGYNQWGELGVGDTIPRGDLPGQMGVNLPEVNIVW